MWQLLLNLSHSQLLHESTPIIVACVYIFVVDETVYVKPIEPSCSSRQQRNDEEEKKQEEEKKKDDEEEKCEGKWS